MMAPPMSATDNTPRVATGEYLPPDAAGLAVLDNAAFGAANEVTPKFIAPADPAVDRSAS